MILNLFTDSLGKICILLSRILTTRMNTINIVLLEDDSIDRIKVEIMIMQFTSKEYNFKLVRTFERLETLIEFLETERVDIIISDIFTNKRATGIELLKKIKNNIIPVILITQSLSPEVYQEAKEYHNIQYLIKGISKN